MSTPIRIALTLFGVLAMLGSGALGVLMLTWMFHASTHLIGAGCGFAGVVTWTLCALATLYTLPGNAAKLYVLPVVAMAVCAFGTWGHIIIALWNH